MNWENTYREFIEDDDIGNPDEELERMNLFLDKIGSMGGSGGRHLVRHFKNVLIRMTSDDMVEVAGMITLAEELSDIKF